MATKCSNKTCKRSATPGFKRCQHCRDYTANYMRTYMNKASPNARKYRANHYEQVRRLNKLWCQHNKDKRLLSNLVNAEVSSGRLHKPKACQRCGTAAGPIVAHGVTQLQVTLPKCRVKVKNWYCWKCWKYSSAIKAAESSKNSHQ